MLERFVLQVPRSALVLDRFALQLPRLLLQVPRSAFVLERFVLQVPRSALVLDRFVLQVPRLEVQVDRLPEQLPVAARAVSHSDRSLAHAIGSSGRAAPVVTAVVTLSSQALRKSRTSVTSPSLAQTPEPALVSAAPYLSTNVASHLL